MNELKSYHLRFNCWESHLHINDGLINRFIEEDLAKVTEDSKKWLVVQDSSWAELVSGQNEKGFYPLWKPLAVTDIDCKHTERLLVLRQYS